VVAELDADGRDELAREVEMLGGSHRSQERVELHVRVGEEVVNASDLADKVVLLTVESDKMRISRCRAAAAA